MTLPRKKSRTISTDGVTYRWLVSMHRSVLHLTIELADDPGQILQALFEPHDLYKQKNEDQWSFYRQGRSITSGNVLRIINHGLANGWQPSVNGLKLIQIHTWDSDRITPLSANATQEEVALKDLAIDQVDDLRFDLSLDVPWREILIAAPQFERYPIPDDYFALSDRVRECGLHFSAFNDGWTECGLVVFGIESVNFPDVIMYTTNSPVANPWAK